MKLTLLYTEFIRRTELFLKTDIRYLLKNTAWLFLAQGIAAISGLALTVAYANLLPQDSYGSLRYLLAVTSILSLTTLPGAATVVTRELSRGNNYYTHAIRLRLYASLLGSAVALLGAGYYFAAAAAPWLIAGYIAIALALPLSEIYTTIFSAFEGKRNFRMRSITGIIDIIVPALAVIGTLFISTNVVVILLVLFGSHALIRGGTHMLFAPKEEPIRVSKEGFRDSVTLSVFQALSTASMHIDKILLFTLLGPASVATFAIANSFPERLKDFPRILGILSFPKFSVKEPKIVLETLPRKIFLLTIVILGIAVAYTLIAPLLFQYLFPTYLEALLPSQLLSFTLVYAAAYPLGGLFTAHGYMRALYGTAIISSLVGIGAMALLIPLYGIWGAVFGTIAGRIAHVSASFYYYGSFRKFLLKK